MDESIITATASAGALIISIASFIFAVLSWRESHRPIVTARISSDLGGNVATPAELVIENTGNRPAVNVRLSVDHQQLDSALAVGDDHPQRRSIERCFDSKTFIPVLANAKCVKNSFGLVAGEKPTWRYKSVIDVTITYRDLRGRRFRNTVPIWLVDNRDFALSHYERST